MLSIPQVAALGPGRVRQVDIAEAIPAHVQPSFTRE